MRARRALGALLACVLGAILRSLGVNIPCLGVNGVLPRHAEPGAVRRLRPENGDIVPDSGTPLPFSNASGPGVEQ